MLRIQTIEHDNNTLKIIPSNYLHSSKNLYTVIVGKNGVGKSRLLASLVKEGIKQSEKIGFFQDSMSLDPLVIAISMSPFDKFPNFPKSKEKNYFGYRYVGMRGDRLYASSSAIPLLASACQGLLAKFLVDSNRANLLEAFFALSFSPSATFVFKPSFVKVDASRPESQWRDTSYFKVDTSDNKDSFLVDVRHLEKYRSLSSEEKSNISYAMVHASRFLHSRKAIELAINFEKGRALIDDRIILPHEMNSILILMNIGLIRLMDLRMLKLDCGEISLKKASSGEQCLFTLILGIAGYIQDGSLILIDEPEISLHPAWQEQFMHLLYSSFAKYKNCQFVIATHSPQIVSTTEAGSAFILSLTDNKLHSSKRFHHKSTDYQLAELFDSPGFMNEYISRKSFALISKIKIHKAVNDDIQQELMKLIELKLKLSNFDPVIQLIESAEELYNYYANDK